MKTDKEYPSTHSMSTSWFGIDKDGKIAVIDFNENGPVPSFLGEESLESIIEDVLPSKDIDGIVNLKFTDRQALHLIKALEDVDLEHPVDFTYIIKINPDKTERFISLFMKNRQKVNSEGDDIKLLCLSSKYGVYVHEFYDWAEEDINSLYTEDILQKSIEFDFWCDEKWSEEEEKWTFNINFKNLPFYHYQQPYWPGQLIERTYIPKFPIYDTQLDPFLKKLALRFPFSFETQKLFQISEFTPCQSHGGSDYLETEPESPHRILYPSTGNTIVKVDENSFFEAMSDTPRIIVLDDTQCYNSLHLSKELPFINFSMVFACCRNPSHPWDMNEENTGFDELCSLFESNKDRFENLVEITQPYCIIAMPKSFEVVADSYPTEEGHILICGYKIPLMTIEEAQNNPELIERFRSMPYRGQDLKRIVRE